MRPTAVALLIFITVVLMAVPRVAPAQAAKEAASDAVGTYVGREIGRGRGEVVTLILSPGGDAAVAIAPAPGLRPLVSRGTWRMVTQGTIMVSIAGEAGSGILYFNRFDDQLSAVDTGFGIRRGFPLQLFRQAPVPGVYTAVRSGVNLLQTLTLQLNPDGTALLEVEQTAPKAPPVTWTGHWTQVPSGDVQVSLSGQGVSDRFTLYRSSDGVFTMSDWNRGIWGSAPLVFVRG